MKLLKIQARRSFGEAQDEIERPSRIEVRVSGGQVEVAGRSVIVAEGKLFL